MKKLFLLLTTSLIAFVSFGQQSENLTVSGAITTPDPTGLGQTQQMCFNFSATNGATLLPTETIRFDISFQKVGQNSVENATITSPSYITWTYNPVLLSWEGVIDSDLPQLTTDEVCFDGLIVDEEATVTDAANEAGIGFQVDLVPHSNDPSGTEPDDFSFDYTFTDPSLPIELGDFSAQAVGVDAVLDWNTLTETNNSHFEIERSINGAQWDFVHRIESQSIDGNSEAELFYQYTDKEAISYNDEIFYRVKQVDLGVDAPISYTAIRLVTFDESVQLEPKIFPNPVISGTPVNIQANNIQVVHVYNMAGELVNVIDENNVRSTSIDTSELSKGMYTVVINNSEKLKFVVQ